MNVCSEVEEKKRYLKIWANKKQIICISHLPLEMKYQLYLLNYGYLKGINFHATCKGFFSPIRLHTVAMLSLYNN